MFTTILNPEIRLAVRRGFVVCFLLSVLISFLLGVWVFSYLARDIFSVTHSLGESASVLSENVSSLNRDSQDFEERLSSLERQLISSESFAQIVEVEKTVERIVEVEVMVPVTVTEPSEYSLLWPFAGISENAHDFLIIEFRVEGTVSRIFFWGGALPENPDSVDLVPDELVSSMEASGVRECFLFFESGNAELEALLTEFGVAWEDAICINP